MKINATLKVSAEEFYNYLISQIQKDIIDSSLKDRESPYFFKISKKGIIQSVFYIQNNMLSVFNEYILFLKSTTI